MQRARFFFFLLVLQKLGKGKAVKTEGWYFVSKERDKGRAAAKHSEDTSNPASAPRFAGVCSCVFNTRAFSFLITQIAPVTGDSVGQTVWEKRKMEVCRSRFCGCLQQSVRSFQVCFRVKLNNTFFFFFCFKDWNSLEQP